MCTLQFNTAALASLFFYEIDYSYEKTVGKVIIHYMFVTDGDGVICNLCAFVLKLQIGEMHQDL